MVSWRVGFENSCNIGDIMADITVQVLTTLGLVTTYTAAEAAGDTFKNDGHTLIHVKESGGAAKTITIASQVSPVPKGLVALNISIEVTANAELMAGFFDKSAYNNSSAQVEMTYSNHANLTIAAISVT